MVISSTKIFLTLVLINLSLFIVYIITSSSAIAQSEFASNYSGILDLFNLDGESNLSTWYSSLLLLTSALILFFIHTCNQKTKYPRHWLALSLILLFASADEAAMIHEKARYISLLFTDDFSGVFTNYWWMPVMFGLLIVSLFFIKFFLALPRRTQALLTISGAMFIGGAVGLEMFAGWYYDTYRQVPPSLVMGTEELMEMIGSSTLIFTLLDYIKRHVPENSRPKFSLT